MPGVPILFVDGVKPCSTCGDSKPEDQYSKDRNTKSGFALSCKSCQRLYKLGRGETIYAFREKRRVVRIAQALERRVDREARLSALRAEREAEGLKPTGRKPKELVDGKKHCAACDTVKPVGDFYRDKKTATGLAGRCKKCASEYGKGTAKRRGYRLMNKYGLTMLEYEKLFDQQEGVCLICLRSPQDCPRGILSVDHCHASGAIRGLLCDHCNKGLGHFMDNPELLLAAARYLESNAGS